MPYRMNFYKPPETFRPPDLGQTTKAERDRFYTGSPWQRCRRSFLAEHPLCQRCNLTPATIAHHVVERLQDPSLALVHDNLEALCAKCHSAEHARRRAMRNDRG